MEVMSKLDSTFKSKLNEELSGKFNLPDETNVDYDKGEYYDDKLNLALGEWIKYLKDNNIYGDEEILDNLTKMGSEILKRQYKPSNFSGYDASGMKQEPY